MIDEHLYNASEEILLFGGRQIFSMFDHALQAIAAGLTTDSDLAGVAIIRGDDHWAGMVSRSGAVAGTTGRYLFYSFTKTIVAAALLRRFARAGWTLDLAAANWLGSPAGAGRFTVRQLLAHTAGLPDYGSLPSYGTAVRAGGPHWSRDEYLARTGAERLLFKPGQGWAYSNIGYMLVKDIFEAVADAPLGQVLAHDVFAPLGVADAEVPVEQMDLQPYTFGFSRQLGGQAVAAGYHPGWIATGVVGGTPLSAARILHGLMSGSLLPPDMLADLRRPRAVGGMSGSRGWRKPGYGLGLMVEMAKGCSGAEGHSGSGPGCSPVVYHFPHLRTPSTICLVTHDEDVGQAERLAMTAAKKLEVL